MEAESGESQNNSAGFWRISASWAVRRGKRGLNRVRIGGIDIRLL
jgi:hypothetical protein